MWASIQATCDGWLGSEILLRRTPERVLDSGAPLDVAGDRDGPLIDRLSEGYQDQACTLRERLSEPEVESVHRRLETMRLDVDDVHLRGPHLKLRRRAPRKLVILPPPTKAALLAWLDAREPEPGTLFVNFGRGSKGRRLTGAVLSRIVGQLGAEDHRIEGGMLSLAADAGAGLAAITPGLWRSCRRH